MMTRSGSAAGVEIEGLQVVVSSTMARVLNDVSLSVAPGEILGIVGESGSGKTTLGLASLGFVRPGLRVASGRASVAGRELLGLQYPDLRRERAGVAAYVPQDPASALNPCLRIGTQLREAVTYGGGSYDDVGERIARVLSQTNLESSPGFLRRYPHQLSGGQQQRLVIAMAFLVSPTLIVMDEPTTGLDVTTQRRVLEAVRSLAGTYGTAVIYVSHDISTVSVLADRVAVLYGGQLMEDGTSTEVLSTPLHPYSQALRQAVPSPDAATPLQGIPGTARRPSRTQRGCVFAPRCPVVTPECIEDTPALRTIGSRRVRCIRTAPGTAVAAPTTQDWATPLREAEGELLAIQGLNASYGQRQILHDVSMSIAPGQCLALVGESGSGKSTLARCIVGLHDHWSGEVRLGSSSLPNGARQRSLEQLRALQYVFQNPYMSLHPRKTIGETLDLTLRRLRPGDRSDRTRRIEEILQEVALPVEVASSLPDRLSGGEKQRVAIARALLAEPAMLVCDEVTSSLDVSVQATLVNLLIRLQRARGLGLLFITHNLALVRSVAQEVAILANGHIVETGKTESVLGAPKSEYAVTLLRDLPRLPPMAATRSVEARI